MSRVCLRLCYLSDPRAVELSVFSDRFVRAATAINRAGVFYRISTTLSSVWNMELTDNINRIV